MFMHSFFLVGVYARGNWTSQPQNACKRWEFHPCRSVVSHPEHKSHLSRPQGRQGVVDFSSWVHFAFVWAPYYCITHATHLSFQIRYADLVSKIVESRLLSCWGLPFLSLNLIKGAPSTILPIWTSSQEDLWSHQSFSARGQISFHEGEFSHLKRMCSIVSISPHSAQRCCCSKFGILHQWSLILKPLWRTFHRKFLMFLGRSVCLILQMSALVGVDPLSAWTVNWVSVSLILVAILGFTDSHILDQINAL